MEISATDFSAPIGASVFKFCVHLQEGEVYYVNGNEDANPHFAFFFHCLSVPLFVHFSFSPMKISATDFSAPIGASVFKFCVHLQEGKVYCVNGN